MTQKDLSAQLLFNQGLNREFDTQAYPNSAKELSNWEPTPDGGLLTRRKWMQASTTGAPGTRKIRNIGHMPVQSGYQTPIRRQRKKAMRAGSNANKITAIDPEWWFPTMDKSFLLAVVSWVNFNADFSHTSTSAITCTPPAGWTSILGPINGPDSNAGTGGVQSTISMQFFAIKNSAEREGAEEFTFDSGGVRRVIVELMEWRGVQTANTLQGSGDSVVDKTATDSGYDTQPSTGTTASTTLFKELAIGAIAGHTLDKEIRQTDFSEGWYDFRDVNHPPQNNVGGNDNWLNLVVARRVTEETAQYELQSRFSEDVEEDDAIAYWVGGIVTLRAKQIHANDRDYILVDNANSATEHSLYEIDPDNLTGDSWTSVGTIISTDTTEHRTAFASGIGGILISAKDFRKVDGHGRNGLYQWDGEALIKIFRSPAARCLAFWGDRFWAANVKDHPNRLYWSGRGDQTYWDEDAWIDIGEDGEGILDIAPVLDGLLIAKRDSLHFLTWSGGPASKPLAGGNGSKGNCICPIPGGAVIAGRYQVWMWQGGAPKPISSPLADWWASPYAAGDREFTFTAYVDGKVYISRALDNAFAVLNTDMGVWWTDLPGKECEVVACFDGHTLLAAPYNDTAWSPVRFQLHPEGDRARDETTAERFHARTQALMLGTPGRLINPQTLYIAYEIENLNRGEATLKVTPIYDGHEQTPRYLKARKGEGTFREPVSVGVYNRSSIHKVQYDFELDLTADEETTVNIEYLELRYDQEGWWG